MTLYRVTIDKNYNVVSKDNVVMIGEGEDIKEKLEELDAYCFNSITRLWIAGSKGEIKLQISEDGNLVLSFFFARVKQILYYRRDDIKL